MSPTFEVKSADTEDLLDTVTVTGGGIAYTTGEARDLVESRMRLLRDTNSAATSLDGWSNGYVTITRVNDFAARLTGDSIRALREPGSEA